MAKAFPNTGATIIDTSADLPAASAALEGVMMFQKDTNELKICDGTNWISMLDTDNKPLDAWTDYTPTLAQGSATNIAKFVNYAKYLVIGKTMFVRIRLTAQAAGVAGNKITITTPSSFTILGDVHAIGFGQYGDSGTGNYCFVAITDYPATNRFLMAATHNISGTGIGVDPNIAVANNDDIRVNIVCEIA